MDEDFDLDFFNALLAMLSSYDSTTYKVSRNEVLNLLASQVYDRKHCESPIEFIMTRKLGKFLETFNLRYRKNFAIEHQRKIEARGKKYRVDMLIKRVRGKGPEIIIECDGHEFHEKTKEQAQKDKERDRNLQLLGYKVIRFTGSEIFNNPDKCAAEVLDHLME